MGGQDDSQPDNSAAANTENQEQEPSGLENIEPEVPARITFLDYLKSPIVELSVGKDDDLTVLHAHQRLLEQSPYLYEKINALDDGDAVGTTSALPPALAILSPLPETR